MTRALRRRRRDIEQPALFIFQRREHGRQRAAEGAPRGLQGAKAHGPLRRAESDLGDLVARRDDDIAVVDRAGKGQGLMAYWPRSAKTCSFQMRSVRAGSGTGLAIMRRHSSICLAVLDGFA